MKRLGVVVLAVSLSFCGGSGTKTPTSDANQQPAVVSTPSTVANTPPAALAPGEAFTFTADSSTWRVVNTGVKIEFKLCGFTKVQPFPGLQKLVYESDRVTLLPGESATGGWSGTACGWQIDMIDWRTCPKEGAPPVFGGGLKQGIQGGDFCPQPTPSPSPTPTPSPSPSPTPPPCTNWSKVTVTATSQESGNWSILAGTTTLWTGRLAKGESHSEAYPANGATLKLKYGSGTYATGIATCPQIGQSCTGTLVFTCGCTVGD